MEWGTLWKEWNESKMASSLTPSLILKQSFTLLHRLWKHAVGSWLRDGQALVVEPCSFQKKHDCVAPCWTQLNMVGFCLSNLRILAMVADSCDCQTFHFVLFAWTEIIQQQMEFICIWFICLNALCCYMLNNHDRFMDRKSQSYCSWPDHTWRKEQIVSLRNWQVFHWLLKTHQAHFRVPPFWRAQGTSTESCKSALVCSDHHIRTVKVREKQKKQFCCLSALLQCLLQAYSIYFCNSRSQSRVSYLTSQLITN